MRRRGKTTQKLAAFTLMEVMITMFLMSVLCLGVFVGMQQVTKAMMNVAIRDEAYHLMQAEAERLLSSDYTSFNASAAQTITSAVKTTILPNSVAQFGFTGDNAIGRVTFTRQVVAVASTSSSKTLRVQVQWTWQGRTNTVSVPLFRNQ